MAYIDSTYLNNAYGAAQVAGLCPSAQELAQTIAQAEAVVDGALMVGGYTRRTSASVVATTPELIKSAVFGQWVRLAHGRNTLDIPSGYWTDINLLAQLREGTLEIDGESRSVVRGTGGIAMSDNSTTSANGKPQVFGRKNMSGF